MELVFSIKKKKITFFEKLYGPLCLTAWFLTAPFYTSRTMTLDLWVLIRLREKSTTENKLVDVVVTEEFSCKFSGSSCQSQLVGSRILAENIPPLIPLTLQQFHNESVEPNESHVARTTPEGNLLFIH